MGAVLLLLAAWVGCSLVACLLVAAVVARAERRPAPLTALLPARQVPDLAPARGDEAALREAA